MSSNNQTVNTGQQATTNYDVSKIFVYDNRYQKAPYNNSAYGSVSLLAGTPMGRVTSTGFIKPVVSSAADGSQVPVGILSADVVVDGGATVQLPICVSGDVVEDKLNLAAGDTLDTTIASGGVSQRYRDRLQAIGINVIANTEMTGYDN